MKVKDLIDALKEVDQEATVVTIKLKEDKRHHIVECHCVHKRIDGTGDVELIFGGKAHKLPDGAITYTSKWEKEGGGFFIPPGQNIFLMNLVVAHLI